MEYVTESKIIISDEKILQCAYVLKDGKAIAALITEPIFTSSERKELKSETEKELKSRLGVDEVLVTFSARIYAMIELGKSYDEIAALL
ncbi:MAG: hypothetical protein ACI4MT_03895 [Christensenellales bacterium]